MKKHPKLEQTKTEKVLAYLKTGHSLDIPKATALWGHIRLSDVIFRLRKKGHNILTQMVQSPNSDVEFGIYRLPQHPNADTRKGRKVRVLPGFPYAGKEGRFMGADGKTGWNCLVSMGDPIGTIGFNYTELEVI